MFIEIDPLREQVLLRKLLPERLSRTINHCTLVLNREFSQVNTHGTPQNRLSGFLTYTTHLIH